MEKKNITRRQFVAGISGSAGILYFGNKSIESVPGGTFKSSDPLQKVTLGKTGIKSTLLGMGTGFNGYNRTSAITRAGIAESLIRHAYDKGIRFFDCADSYGTHPFIAAAFKNIPRENYTLSSKMWVTAGGIPEQDKADANIVVDRFRKELKTDYIDLIQLHCMTTGDWTSLQKKQMDILETLKIKGIIRAHGVSVHSFEALEAAAINPWVDVIHIRINPFGDNMDNKDPKMVIPLIEKIHRAGKGIIGMKLIGNGKFKDDSEKVDTSLKFVLGLNRVDLIIVGFEHPEQIDNYLDRIQNALKSKSKI